MEGEVNLFTYFVLKKVPNIVCFMKAKTLTRRMSLTELSPKYETQIYCSRYQVNERSNLCDLKHKHALLMHNKKCSYIFNV